MKIKSAEEKVIGILEKNSDGSTITELVGKLDLSRSTVRVALARLEGERKISYRNIGMAKVYVIGGGR
jgi:predicted transcriptional regulator